MTRHSKLLPTLAILAACVSPASDGTAATTSSITAPTETTTSVPEQNRDLTHTIAIGPDGFSAPFQFEIPDKTRSISITAVGSSDDMIALASLSLPDGTEHVGLREAEWLPDLLESQREDHQPTIPGDIYQETGKGTLTLLFPETAGDLLPPGPAELLISSTGEQVELRVQLPPAIGENPRFELDIFSVDGAGAAGDSINPGILLTTEGIFREAGIEIIWSSDLILSIDDLSTLDPEDPTAPGGTLEHLVEEAAPLGTEGLDVFIVSRMGSGISGLAPFIPGPALPHRLGGVVVREAGTPTDIGRVIAHEIAHYLGLRHPSDHADGGEIITDQFTDTNPGEGNLMEAGATLTRQQVAFLRLSPLLADPPD